MKKTLKKFKKTSSTGSILEKVTKNNSIHTDFG